ncbi:MAG: hypothetical protein NXI10_17390 [bacterium]|nr:hypothetical protein [bacterium]
MIQILILFFLGRWLYQLAKKHKKPNPLLYGLFAILIYIGVAFVLGFILGVILVLMGRDVVFSKGEELLLTLALLPFSIGGVALFHYLLKRKWSREIPSGDGLLDETIDQIDK